MNAQRYALPEVEVSQENAGDAVRAILHTILLSRALGEITPRAGSCHNYPTMSYAKCSEVDSEVESLVDRVKRPNERKAVGPDLSRADVILSFYERREKTGLLGFVSTEERFYWEHWLIPVIVNNTKHPTGPELLREESGVRATLLRIATLVNERSDHLPHSPSTIVFPFEIKLAGDDAMAKTPDSAWSFARILQQARPPI